MKSSHLPIQSLAIAGLGVLLAGSAVAQTTLYEFTGAASNDRLGAGLAAAGDLNGDGVTELLVGVPQDGNAFTAGNGLLELRDGATGSVLTSWSGLGFADAFGTAVDGGEDVDGDGVPDIVVGSPFYSGSGITGAGLTTVLSGASYSVLGQVPGGSTQENIGLTVKLTGDLDGDGLSEIMTGSLDAFSNRGVVRVYTLAGGGLSLMYEWVGANGGSRFGISFDTISDINSDGVVDLLIGSAFRGYYIYSGADGTELRNTTLASESTLGTSVCSIPDLNGDGIDEIVTGAIQAGVFNPGPGRVYVRSGLTDTTLFTVDGATAGDRFGWKVADAGDWNGDGKNDFLVTSDPNTGVGFVTLHSGDGGAVLSTFTGDSASDQIGEAITSLGDLDGDNKVEIMIGSPGATTGLIRQGMARIYSSPFEGCGGIVSYCGNATANSGGSPATIAVLGSTSVSDETLILQASNVVANGFGLFYYGPDRINQTVGNGIRCVGGSTLRLAPTQATGTQVLKNLFDDPNSASITGNATLNFQYWYRDIPAGGAGFNFSDALEIRFCN